jgi:hypothetical protein
MVAGRDWPPGKEYGMTLSRRLRRVAPLLFALLITAVPLTAAAGRHPSREMRQWQLGITELLSKAWDLVSPVWEKEGSSTDPFGNPKPNTAQPPSGSPSVASDAPPSGK